MDQLKVYLIGVTVPHGVLLGASSAIDMRKDDEFTVTFLAQLLLKPEHLLHSTTWSHLMSSLRCIVKSIDGEQGDLIIQVHSIVASNIESLTNSLHLFFCEIFLVAWESIKPKVKDLLMELLMLLIGNWVIYTRHVCVTKRRKHQCIWEVVSK